MRALWMFIKFFLLLIIGAVGAMFALENGQQLAVNFVLFQGPSLSLGLWALIGDVAALGMAAGTLGFVAGLLSLVEGQAPRAIHGRLVAFLSAGSRLSEEAQTAA